MTQDFASPQDKGQQKSGWNGLDGREWQGYDAANRSDPLLHLLVDTDMAFDDWLALVYLVQCSKVELSAVTIAATGEAHAGPGVKNALRILGLKDKNVPVTSGRTVPLRGKNTFPALVRFVMDFRLGVSFPKARYGSTNLPAAELISNQLESTPNKATIITLGPLTNLAEALLAKPGLIDKIAMIYTMGGAVNVPGNIDEIVPNTNNRYAEWNIYIDPYAADVVMRSGAPITFVTLDVTNKIRFTDNFYDRLSVTKRTEASDFAFRLVRRIKTLSGKRPVYFWDPLTAVIATYPQIARYETRRLRVVQTEGAECGRLIEDESGYAVQVCSDVDSAAFDEIFLSVLNGIAVPARERVEEDLTETIE